MIKVVDRGYQHREKSTLAKGLIGNSCEPGLIPNLDLCRNLKSLKPQRVRPGDNRLLFVRHLCGEELLVEDVAVVEDPRGVRRHVAGPGKVLDNSELSLRRQFLRNFFIT